MIVFTLSSSWFRIPCGAVPVGQDPHAIPPQEASRERYRIVSIPRAKADVATTHHSSVSNSTFRDMPHSCGIVVARDVDVGCEMANSDTHGVYEVHQQNLVCANLFKQRCYD